jgi:DNA-binding response OmpR family regulator
VGLIRVEGLAVDLRARRAWYGTTELRLSRLEFDFLAHLTRAPTAVTSKEELLRQVWGFRSLGRTRTVDSHASRTRMALMRAGAEPGEWVINVWGHGYSLRRAADAPFRSERLSAAPRLGLGH